jgi:hypothetical protein
LRRRRRQRLRSLLERPGRAQGAGARRRRLVISIPLNLAMSTPRQAVHEEALDRFADDGVRVFVDVYGRRPTTPRRRKT